MVRNDQDFWDWYTRRLSGDTKFLRDVVARKSFSKLRSAIAGLYARQRRFADAENAFQQSRILYPLSPEANFRLVQEVLMQLGRFQEAIDLMRVFQQQDPGNDRVPEFIRYLERAMNISTRIKTLEATRSSGKMDVQAAMELAESYLQVQRMGEFMSMMNGVLTATNMPPGIYYNAATLLHSAKQFPEMTRALDLCVGSIPADAPPDIFLSISRMYSDAGHPERMLAPLQLYLKKKPTDWKAWLETAAVQLLTGQANLASQSLLKARQHGGEEALNAIQQDERFAAFRSRPQPNLMGIPGMVTPEGREAPPF
jgi:thioredoxin-like negative regulator of GroEL